MSDSRIVSMRKSESFDSSNLSLPFLFIQPQFGYSVNSILRPIHTSSQVDLGKYPNTFPRTIKEFFWTKEGQAGISPWIALGILENGLYFLYVAYCNAVPTTFLNGGLMNLWVSKRYSDLIHYGMDKTIYEIYLKDTLEN
jgi:hypothetical protein